jgi:hypothetical protein
MSLSLKLVFASLLSLLTIAGCSAGTDGAADAADADTGKPDAGACVDCKPSFLCLFTPGGDVLDIKATKRSHGACALASAVLVCGGTGTAATGRPLTWEVGDKLGPTGGPGMLVKFDDRQLNCE